MEKSNRYIIIYASVMVIIVAVVLTILAVQLKPAQDANIRVEKMQNLLQTININTADLTQDEIMSLFEKTIVSGVLINNKGEIVSNDLDETFNTELGNELKKPVEEQRYPVYQSVTADNDTLSIIQLHGKGLWGPIWGYLAFKSDFNTVAGCVFAHKGETPGLGAEIAESWYQEKFINKTVFDDNNNLVSIKVVKGGVAPDDLHSVDAITGGTITSDGLQDMIADILDAYKPFFESKRQ
ncbi:MAG: NADH:ubiquinone reductase (Na(+)-transporting) subunit C [Bacteroidales bacterium]|jgi:Na+-transporting NADH:ubiquinone oxidoreductase subunit C